MFAIIITAYNRAEPLRILLESLSKVKNCGEKVPLIISIDNYGTPDVNRIAEEYQWHLGEKKVIIRDHKLGLVSHFMWVGDQTSEFDHVIFLEDDLVVSPDLLLYSRQIIEFYENDDNVAAASLYNPILNEATGTKFYQVDDGYDVYFLQHPYWGNIWFKSKWKAFQEYMKDYSIKNEILPPNIAKWDKSFKKKYIQYLIETKRTVVLPRNSIVTNNGCPGLHNFREPTMYQNVIRLYCHDLRLVPLEESLSKYDSFNEIYPDILKKLNLSLAPYDFEVDLNGTRKLFNTEYVLTTRPVYNAVLRYTSQMKPVENGVLFNIVGNREVKLCKVSDLVEDASYYKMRKWNDIEKNYYIITSFSFLLLAIRKAWNYNMNRFKGYIKRNG